VEAFGDLLRACEERLRIRGAPPAPAPVTPAAGASAQGTGAAFDPHTTHRLLRWPGTDVLQDQRQRKILASFLVSRPLSLNQLVSLSGIGQNVCIDFLHTLAGLGLLESRAVAVRPATSAGAARAVPPGQAGRPPASSLPDGLIGRLRKRLGLL